MMVDNKIKKRHRVKVDDVVEIDIGEKLSYTQLTHRIKGPFERDIARVISGLHDDRPILDNESLFRKTLFKTSLFFSAEISSGLVRFVSNIPVPTEDVDFPLFRSEGGIDRQGRILDWFLWRGGASVYIGQLPQELYSLSVRGIRNHGALVFDIERQWRPENDAPKEAQS